MKMQQTFLLSKAKIFKMSEMEKADYTYDYNCELNMTEENGVTTIAVSSQRFSPTQSKTMAAPGDDDPDDERCY